MALIATKDRSRLVSTTVTVALVGSLLLLLSACAAGANPDVGSAPSGEANPAGFWLGLWHGAILPISWVVSLFTDTVSPYEVHNSGNWYDVGFVAGVAAAFGGPFGARQAAKR